MLICLVCNGKVLSWHYMRQYYSVAYMCIHCITELSLSVGLICDASIVAAFTHVYSIDSPL